ncbi:hypothetical protein C1I95_33495 [Micromonospora craterilacus]|uniref:DUF3558 domain-containing protein n=1 Tax=Micromonospora craterilacus TaxID=1655439 RepID=A0A2W2D038_9ACTN|nr:hypothetical protein [Micromonospora craterilacus]PZG04073.1 hypothetical protein C1I95_33495 [Micromonospora craterilacus]
MRRLILPVVFAATLALAGCNSTEPPSPEAGAGVDADADLDLPADDNGARPDCPFTADQITEFVGQSMVDQGNCSFGDGKGVALLSVTTASRLAGETTYDYQRQQADQIYQEVTELGGDSKGYLAVKDIGAEAVMIGGAGSFTITLSSFERLGAQSDGYEQALRRLLDALPR